WSIRQKPFQNVHGVLPGNGPIVHALAVVLYTPYISSRRNDRSSIRQIVTAQPETAISAGNRRRGSPQLPPEMQPVVHLLVQPAIIRNIIENVKDCRSWFPVRLSRRNSYLVVIRISIGQFFDSGSWQPTHLVACRVSGFHPSATIICHQH